MQVEVFVSYARADIELARQLIEKLKEEGIRVWWDKMIPLGSKTSSTEITEAILAAQSFLVLWSEKSQTSRWVIGEVEKAVENNAQPIQLVVGDISLLAPYNAAPWKRIIIDEEGQISEDFLTEITDDIKKIIGIQGPKEHLIRARGAGEGWKFEDLALETPVPGLDYFVSFRPCDKNGVFLLMRLDTTDGWVDETIPSAQERHKPYEGEPDSTYEVEDDNGEITKYLKVQNDVFFIMDPLRPYGIQIGGLRSKRPSASPGVIKGEEISIDQLEALSTNLEWVSMTLAEILSTEEALRYLWNDVKDQPDRKLSKASKRRIQKLISKNPNAPKDLQKEMCVFCDEKFIEKRRLSDDKREDEYGAYVIANDFPFGPAFHYLAVTKTKEEEENEPVHSWEDLKYRHIKGLNLIIHDFLQDKANRKGAAGISFGFNSTIRHLILGSNTRSSAGASIPHIHKQVWGMAQRSTNLAERLIEVSQAYWNHNVDYQGAYIEALREAGYVIWEDKYVALYVPYGQCSKFELQAMVLKPRGCLTDLKTKEVVSLSKAEYIALRLFKELEINSFNHVVLSKLYDDTRAPSFRLVEAFITREVDLAVSELSMLFVVDQHPWDARNEINAIWGEIRADVLREIEGKEGGGVPVDMPSRRRR